MTPGPQNSITDIAGLKIGHAQDAHIKTGTTVLVPDAPLTASVHVMGGAPGTRETDLLAPDKTVDQVHALVLSGGSAFGLDAASGVMDALARDKIGYQVGPATVPIVPAAILFDLLNGGDKDWAENPYRKLGLEAYKNAKTSTDLGTIGAGTGATAGDLKGGLGTASLQLPGGITVAALVACNALGNTTTPSGHFWAAPFEMDAEFGAKGAGPAPTTTDTFANKLSQMQNTTIAIVVTDADLSKPQCHRMAVAAHDGMARAIVPAHTPMDGDLIFAASTNAKPLSDPGMDMLNIGHAAALCLARAIARGIYHATPAQNDLSPTWASRFGSST